MFRFARSRRRTSSRHITGATIASSHIFAQAVSQNATG
jgi:hypothetical protein